MFNTLNVCWHTLYDIYELKFFFLSKQASLHCNGKLLCNGLTVHPLLRQATCAALTEQFSSNKSVEKMRLGQLPEEIDRIRQLHSSHGLIFLLGERGVPHFHFKSRKQQQMKRASTPKVLKLTMTYASTIDPS